MPLHPTAMIDRAAEIHPHAEIGAYCIIEGPVKVGAGTRVSANVYLAGHTSLGLNCEIHPFACIGDLPQDLAFKPSVSYCSVGDGTVVGARVTIHRGTAANSVTEVGKRCRLKPHSHVGHNCVLGDHVVLEPGALLGGHARIGARAVLSSKVGLHQFVRVGELAVLGEVIKVAMDVPPFFCVGPRATCEAVNVAGLREAGFSVAEQEEIVQAFELLYRSDKPFRAAVDELDRTVQTQPGRRLVQFLQEPSKRGVISGRADLA